VNSWQEYFQTMLNCLEPTMTHDWNCARTSVQLPVNMDSVSDAEVRVTVKQLKNGKATGIDSIQLELLKSADFIIPFLTRV